MPDNPLYYYMDSWDFSFDKDSAVNTATPTVFLADSQLETLPVRKITEKFTFYGDANDELYLPAKTGPRMQ
jgi:hypothetical protein